MCRSYSHGIFCGVCHTNPGWHLEFKAKTVIDMPSLQGMASFFTLCDENTHLYLAVLDMPREVTHVRSMGGTAPSPQDCPFCPFAMATPSFPPFPTRSSPPFTSPPVWVSF